MTGPFVSALSVIDPVARTVVANITLPRTGPFSIAAVAGCASGETVVVAPAYATGAATTALTVAPPSAGTAPVTTNLTSVIAPRLASVPGAAPSYFASDANCGIYSANDATLTRYSGFPAATGTPVGATGWTANSSLAVQGNTLYGITVSTTPAGAPGSPPTVTGTLQSVPLSGGPAQSLGSLFSGSYDADLGMEVGGVHVYDLNTSCGNSYLTSIPGRHTTSAGTGTTTPHDFTVAPNGTVYFLTGSSSGGRTSGHVVSPEEAQRYAAARRAGMAGRQPLMVATAAPEVTLTGNAAAVTADGRFIAVGTSGSGATPASVQVYAIPAAPGATPNPVGSPIPLPSAQPLLGRLVFPH